VQIELVSPSSVKDVDRFDVVFIPLFWMKITQGVDFVRHVGFAVQLSDSEKKTQGVALVNQVRMMDLEEHVAKKMMRKSLNT
jgi:mRNA-degrading endonuclease toxin of MazEF toxin-antitoxin module